MDNDVEKAKTDSLRLVARKRNDWQAEKLRTVL
jgi:hypothetical protein